MHTFDEMVAKLIRTAGLSKKVISVANKVDDPSWDADGIEAAALGFGEPVLVSANSGYGTRMLKEALWERLGNVSVTEPIPSVSKPSVSKPSVSKPTVSKPAAQAAPKPQPQSNTKSS